jgi:hypothetical protein
MYVSKSMTFSTPHIGHEVRMRHGFFFFSQDWIVNSMLNLLKRTMIYPGFEPGTFGLVIDPIFTFYGYYRKTNLIWKITKICKVRLNKTKQKVNLAIYEKKIDSSIGRFLR